MAIPASFRIENHGRGRNRMVCVRHLRLPEDTGAQNGRAVGLRSSSARRWRWPEQFAARAIQVGIMSERIDKGLYLCCPVRGY